MLFYINFDVCGDCPNGQENRRTKKMKNEKQDSKRKEQEKIAEEMFKGAKLYGG